MRNHHLPKYIVALILFLFIGIYSCKPKQGIVQADSELEDKTSSDLFEDVLYKDLQYSTFSSKLNMNISTGKKDIKLKGKPQNYTQ